MANEHQQQFVPARNVDIKDAAGAGDAFWAGYLTAYLDQKNLTERAIAGRRMAEMKIGQYGPLPDSVDRNDLYAE